MRQAPHCEVSQPTWVPVSRRCSRRNWTRSVRGSTSAVTALPFTVIETDGMAFLLKPGPNGLFSHRTRDPAHKSTRKLSVFGPFPSLEQEQLEPRDQQRSRVRGCAECK